MAAIDLTTTGFYQIGYTEDPDGYGESWVPDAVEVTRTYVTPWLTKFKFVTDMVGWAGTTPDPATGKLSRYLPNVDPDYPKLYCSSCVLVDKRGVPNQDSQGRLTYDQRDAAGAILDAGSGDGSGLAAYKCSFRRFRYYLVEDAAAASELDRYVVRLYKPNVENLTLPGQAFNWGGASETGTPAGAAIPTLLADPDFADSPIPGDTAKRFGTLALRYEWYQVPIIPLANIQAALGCVNSATFDNYWPAQTLLMLPPEITPVMHPTSEPYFTIVYNFVYRPKGWNKLYSRKYSDFFKVVSKADSSKGIYETYDFGNLFKLN